MQSFLSQFRPPVSAVWKLRGYSGQAQRDGTAVKCATTQMGLWSPEPAQAELDSLHKFKFMCSLGAEARREGFWGGEWEHLPSPGMWPSSHGPEPPAGGQLENVHPATKPVSLVGFGSFFPLMAPRGWGLRVPLEGKKKNSHPTDMTLHG